MSIRTRRGMARTISALLMAAAMVFAGAKGAKASPSTEYWTPCIMDVQGAGTWHLTYDTYTTRRAGGDFSTDLGLTYGARLSKTVNAEAGFDWFSNVAYPVYFNAKIGVAENTLAANFPGFSFGVMNAGTKKADAAAGITGTKQNVLTLVAGKTVAPNLRVHAGAYAGNSDVLLGSDGLKHNKGLMIAFDYGFMPTKDGYNQFALVGDYMSGKNVLGGGGVGISWAFAKNAGVIFGPVWYNDQGINGKVKWTTQLDVNF